MKPDDASAPGTRATGWLRPPRWTRWELIALPLITVLGLGLRLHGYTHVPPLQANADEWSYGWAGLTLWTKGVPTTWSLFGAYPHVHVVHLHGINYPLVTPWFDQPPLFALVVGIFPLLFGQHTIASVTTEAIRLPAVLLATASITLLQLVGRRLLGPLPALLAAFLFAITPAAVLFGREVESEALLAPMLLLVILLLHRLGTGEGRRPALIVVLTICFLAPLTKIPGLAIGVAAAAVLVYQRRYWPAAAAIAAAGAGLGVFALYGAHYDWSLFTAIFSSQASRRVGVLGAIDYIAAPAGIGHPLIDGWWLLGWIGLVVVAIRFGGPRMLLLVAPAFVYLAAMVIFASEDAVTAFGWYHITVYPEIYLAAAYLVYRVLRKPEPAILTLVLLLGGATATSLWLGAPWVPPTPLLVALLAAAIGPALAAAAWPRRHRLLWVARGASCAALALLAIGLVTQSLFLEKNFGLN
jgi:4-amino-4-deoxy-L-arabinose transferase-like glycosyltransferase